MKNNPVFQVLVVSNPDLATTASDISSLAVGQLGIFDAETNLAIAHNALTEKFYFAVGLPNQAGTLGDIRKSTGEYIKKSLIKRIDSKQYVAPAPAVVSLDLTGFAPVYNESYAIRFTFQSAETMNMSGFTNPSKSFVYTTPNTGTGAYDLATFITNFVAAVNAADPEGLVTATAAAGDVINFTFDSEVYYNTVAGVNPRYGFLRQFNVQYGLSAGFEGKVYTVTYTPPVYEEGRGYDLRQLELVAGGWNGNPGVYRDSELNGLFYGADKQLFAVANVPYWVMVIKHGLDYTSGGSLDYESIFETYIAVPETAENLTLIGNLVTLATTLGLSGSTPAYATTTTTTAPATTTTTTVPATTTTTTGA